MGSENLQETSKHAAEKNEQNIYQVKWIDFNKISYSIVTQNENGPCPLVAVVNVLLLKGQLSLPIKVNFVTEEDLLQSVAGCLLRSKPEGLNEGDALNYEKNVSDVLSLVPSLPGGLDVNVHFDGVHNFEFTPACALFDLLGIPLLHGWVVDPQQKELVRLLGNMGYDQLTEYILRDEHKSESRILSDFLESNASQLTVYGLFELNAALHDGQIAVLFRNNHFHTLHKHKGDLYVLVTDQGFLNEPSVVWETLNSIDGSSLFVDASFRETKPVDVKTSSDHLLALSLQQQTIQEQQSNTNTELHSTPSSSASVPLSASKGHLASETQLQCSKSSDKSHKSDRCHLL